MTLHDEQSRLSDPRRQSQSRLPFAASALAIREETPADLIAREALLDAALGVARRDKPSERLREGREPARGLALIATLNGEVVGTVRLWSIVAGGAPALLLGPLAVSGRHRSLGVGGALMRAALQRARMRAHKAVVLVGDAEYYERFGFSPALTTKLEMPGSDHRRFLGIELQPGALSGAKGTLIAAGRPLRSSMSQRLAA
jgi:predicted N-acetyltransferase YhbS